MEERGPFGGAIVVMMVKEGEDEFDHVWILVGEVNNAILSFLEAVFWIACIREELALGTDDALVCMIDCAVATFDLQVRVLR